MYVDWSYFWSWLYSLQGYMSLLLLFSLYLSLFLFFFCSMSLSTFLPFYFYLNLIWWLFDINSMNILSQLHLCIWRSFLLTLCLVHPLSIPFSALLYFSLSLCLLSLIFILSHICLSYLNWVNPIYITSLPSSLDLCFLLFFPSIVLTFFSILLSISCTIILSFFRYNCLSLFL